MNNLTDSNYIKNFLKNNGFRPKDYMGQNFLVDEIALSQIVEAAELKKTDQVIEVGPGLGVLTGELLKRTDKLVAVEKDRRLYDILKKEFARSDLKLYNEDVLRFHLDENISGAYKVVANIPYYLTSKLFQYFLEQKNQPKLLVLMVQKEVGERVVAKPGNLSVLGLSVQIFSDAEIVAQVPRTSFWPAPEVDSVILKIKPNNSYGSRIKDYRLFFRIVKIAFAGKRKQIQNSLANGLKISKDETLSLLEKAGLDPSIRPQDLSIEEWIRLYNVFDKANPKD